MGALVSPYWSGIEENVTEEQWEHMPGFCNDSKLWGNWMAERNYELPVLEAMRKLNAGAILTLTTDGVADEQVDWELPGNFVRLQKNLEKQSGRDTRNSVYT